MTDTVCVPGPPEKVAATVIDRTAERYRARLPLLPGAIEVVDRLAGHWPLGVASSSPPRRIAAVLRSAGLADRFQLSVSTEEHAAARGKGGAQGGP